MHYRTFLHGRYPFSAVFCAFNAIHYIFFLAPSFSLASWTAYKTVRSLTLSFSKRVFLCSMSFIFVPNYSIIMILNLLLSTSFSYIFFNCSFGVHVTNITIFLPSFLFQFVFFDSFSAFLSSLLHCLGLCSGLVPDLDSSFNFWNALLAALYMSYLNSLL